MARPFGKSRRDFGRPDGPRPFGNRGGGKPRPPLGHRPGGAPHPALHKPNNQTAQNVNNISHVNNIKNAENTSWEHVADWYDRLVGDDGSDYHRNVVLPAALRLLEPKPTHRVLDLCCGQGVLCRKLAEAGVAQIVGVDTSEAMIRAAQTRSAAPNIRYVVADARNLGTLADGSFDSAACLMAVHDLDDIAAVFAGLAGAIKTGGHAVVIMMHPCFRIPRQSSWGWDEKLKTQYRRLDRYASMLSIPIATHPGSDPSQHTSYFHRPLATYLNALGAAGLSVTACEELLSHRQSEPGPRSRAENRARREFPVFLALKVVKLPILGTPY